MGFKRLEADDFVVSAQAQTQTCWTGNEPALTSDSMFTQSNQINGQSGVYYTTVFNTQSGAPDFEAQFEIAYGQKNGGGALAYNQIAAPNVSPASTIYGQYRTLVLEDENAQFVFGEVSQSSFYALSIERARYKQALFPGSFNLTLSSSISTNANKTLFLTDNSKMVIVPTYYGTTRAYQIISGSDGKAYNSGSGGLGYTTTQGSYGLFLPDIGTILLNTAALALDSEEGINLATNQSLNTAGNNPLRMLGPMQSGSFFQLGSEETITSDFVFVRARNSEFNYSENPSYISGSTGEVVFNYFINNPQTYMTTVGLYNDSNELLAVAKLSRPLNKDFTKEALIRVKLDF
jgi:hypothetical protein